MTIIGQAFLAGLLIISISLVLCDEEGRLGDDQLEILQAEDGSGENAYNRPLLSPALESSDIPVINLDGGTEDTTPAGRWTTLDVDEIAEEGELPYKNL